MILSFLALVPIFALYFDDVNASDPLRKISTDRKFSGKDKDGIDSPGTSRLHKQAYRAQTSTSIAQQALNLDGYHANPPGSSNQQISRLFCLPVEVLDFWNQNQFRHVHPPQVSSSPRMIENNRIQQQRPGYSNEFSRQGNINSLRQNHRQGDNNVQPSQFSTSHELILDENTNELKSKPIEKIRFKWPTQDELTKRKMMQADTQKKRRELKIQEPTPPQNIPNSSSMNLSAATEIGFRRRRTIDGRAVVRKDVLDSYGKITPQPGLPQNAFEDYEPDLINNDMNPYKNPYHEFQQKFPDDDHNPHQQ